MQNVSVPNSVLHWVAVNILH